MHTPQLYQSSFAPTLLVVEPIVQTHPKIVTAFSEAGIQCKIVATGQEALDFVMQVGPPKVAIIELVLPDMAGLELVNRLHRIKTFPVILTAFQADPNVVAHLLDSVAEDFMRKPYDLRELVARVQRFLYKHSFSSQPNLQTTENGAYWTNRSRDQFRFVQQ